MRVEDWTAIWYKCLACQRCFQFPDRLIAHKNLTECGSVYKNKLSLLLGSTSADNNNNISAANFLQRSLPLSPINQTLVKIEPPEELQDNADSSENYPENSSSANNKLHHPSNLTLQKYTLRKKSARQNLQLSISKTETKCTKERKGCFIKGENCYFCNKTFANAQSLQLHMGKHTKEMSISCITCGQRFLYSYKLKAHIRKCHKTQPLNTFKNKMTLMYFRQYVERKKKISSLGDLKNRSRLKLLQCKECGKQFEYPSVLKRHQVTHSRIKPFDCNKCRKSFTLFRNLETHMITHTGIKPFECKECRKSFTQAGNLKTHMMTHTGLKPFECKECRKSFTQAGNLKTHMLTHTRLHHFKCEQCGKCFTTLNCLKTHMRIHATFECKECGVRFTQSKNLKRHMVIHSGVSGVKLINVKMWEALSSVQKFNTSPAYTLN